MKALWAIQITSDKEVATVPTEFRPRGGLGLYVCGAKAEFRRVSLTPLPGGG
jgi:hypothetical protein